MMLLLMIMGTNELRMFFLHDARGKQVEHISILSKSESSGYFKVIFLKLFSVVIFVNRKLVPVLVIFVNRKLVPVLVIFVNRKLVPVLVIFVNRKLVPVPIHNV